MPRQRVTTTKRQREQAKRDRQQRKAERRANRQSQRDAETVSSGEAASGTNDAS